MIFFYPLFFNVWFLPTFVRIAFLHVLHALSSPLTVFQKYFRKYFPTKKIPKKIKLFSKIFTLKKMQIYFQKNKKESGTEEFHLAPSSVFLRPSLPLPLSFSRWKFIFRFFSQKKYFGCWLPRTVLMMKNKIPTVDSESSDGSNTPSSKFVCRINSIPFKSKCGETRRRPTNFAWHCGHPFHFCYACPFRSIRYMHQNYFGNSKKEYRYKGACACI